MTFVRMSQTPKIQIKGKKNYTCLNTGKGEQQLSNIYFEVHTILCWGQCFR